MTTPDHHPYLTDGDLRTAEDVLELVKLERARAALELRGKLRVLAGEQVPYGEAFMVAMVAFERVLRLRLDRERRQACRRGALAAWRKFQSSSRSWTKFDDWVYAINLSVWVPPDHVPSSAAEADRAKYARKMLAHLATALAFRAAARAR